MPNKDVVTVNVRGISSIDIKKLEKLATQKESTVESMAESAVEKFLANGCKRPVFAEKV